MKRKEYMELPDERLALLYGEERPDGQELIMDIMLYRYHTVISRIAAPFFLMGADKEDLIQEGRIGLYEAVKGYDITKNDSFAPFARMCIQRAQIKAVTRYNRKKNYPLNTSVSIDDDENDVLGAVSETKVSDPEEIFMGIFDVEEKLNRLRDDLSPFELNVLQYMMEGYDYRQIAKMLGREDKSIDNSIQRIRKKSKSILL